MSHEKFRCTCVPEGQPAPHSRPEQCRANRQATGAYLMAVSSPPVLPDVRDPQGKFVRFATGEEAKLPHGTAVEGGVVRRW